MQERMMVNLWHSWDDAVRRSSTQEGSGKDQLYGQRLGAELTIAFFTLLHCHRLKTGERMGLGS